MFEFVYAVKYARDKRSSGYVVMVRDLPEAITQGDSIEECLQEAAGAIQAALEARIMDSLEIPVPTKARRGERLVAVPLQTALKSALYLAMQEAGITRVELARRLGINEKEARRMLDPYHTTKAERLEQALTALGKQAELRVA